MADLEGVTGPVDGTAREAAAGDTCAIGTAQDPDTR
jgi:hypothetical protein